jgi:hypothetical protein
METRLRKPSGGPPNSQRMLELADIALGLKQPEHKKNPRGSHHQLLKNEPYLIQNKGSKKVRSQASILKASLCHFLAFFFLKPCFVCLLPPGMH